MNLAKEIANAGYYNKEKCNRAISTFAAIEIAEKYANEMCRRQRMLCLSEVNKEYNINFAKTILNAPLATEANNDTI